MELGLGAQSAPGITLVRARADRGRLRGEGASRDGLGVAVTLSRSLLGTPEALVAADGAVLGSLERHAWRMEEAGGLTPFRFPGQYEDEETGLCYNRYRYYDPELGRFISADPVGLRGGTNVFSYAPNAVTWSDPLGLTGEQGPARSCEARRVRPGGAESTDRLERRGTAPESAADLEEQAQRAQSAGFPHGVSVTSRERNASLGVPPDAVSTATRQQFEDAGFPVHYTPGQGRRNPDVTHHTVELPSPVTPEAADRFNRVLGRMP